MKLSGTIIDFCKVDACKFFFSKVWSELGLCAAANLLSGGPEVRQNCRPRPMNSLVSLITRWFQQHRLERPCCPGVWQQVSNMRQPHGNSSSVVCIIGSETWKNRRGNLVGIRIEVRLVQKTFKSRWEPGRIVNSMQMEMSLAKSPNKVCFYKDLHVVSLIVWAVFFQFVTIVNFVIKLFFFCIRFMNSAHTCFTNAYNFSNKVCFYKDLLQ